MCNLFNIIWGLFHVGESSDTLWNMGSMPQPTQFFMDWEFTGLVSMYLPSVPRVSGKDMELIRRLYWIWLSDFTRESAWHKQKGGLISGWALMVLLLWKRSIHFPFKGLWYPLTMGGRDSITTYLFHTAHFAVYSVGSSLTLLVWHWLWWPKWNCQSSCWHQWFCLECSPIYPWCDSCLILANGTLTQGLARAGGEKE